MSSLIVYQLRLWRHNAHKSILRRLRNVCSLLGLVQYWGTEREERVGTVFGHRSQAKSFKHRIRSRAGFLHPDNIASHSENDAVFFPSLLLILCNTHVLWCFQGIGGSSLLYCADPLLQDCRHNMILLCPVLHSGSITEEEFTLGYSVQLCSVGLSCCWNCTSFKGWLCGIDLSTTFIRNFQIFEVWIMRNKESDTN